MKARIKPEAVTKSQVERDFNKGMEFFGENSEFDILISFMNSTYLERLRDPESGKEEILRRINEQFDKYIDEMIANLKEKGFFSLAIIRQLDNYKDLIGRILGEAKEDVPEEFYEKMSAHVKEHLQNLINEFLKENPYYAEAEKYTNNFEFLADYQMPEIINAAYGHKERSKLSLESATRFFELQNLISNKLGNRHENHEIDAIIELLEDENQDLDPENRYILQARLQRIRTLNQKKTVNKSEQSGSGDGR